MKIRHSLLTYVLSLVALSLVNIAISPINAEATSCADVTMIFARGSGAGLNKEENQRWEAGFKRQMGQTHYVFYELGSQSIDGHQYPAVDVANLLNGNAAGAKASGGLGNDYGKSVMEGVQELMAYIRQNNQTCPGMRYILGGYSQGAQVMSQGVQYLAKENRDKVLFLATFGDPKLRLPEGDGFFSVPACDGRDFSPWRRVVDNCRTSNGSLGGWNPYVPDDMRGKTWTWCYAQDFVCGADLNPFDNSGHMRYRNPGMGIDDAANEASRRLSEYLKTIAPEVDPPAQTTTAPKPNDVALVIDTTGSMENQIETAKALAVAIANKVVAAGGRVALTEYRDYGDDFTAEVRCGLTTDVAAFNDAVNKLSAGGGGDNPEGLLHALMTTYNTLQWQQGVSKATIVITDETYHDPDITDGSTTANAIKRSLEIDPVNTYIVTNSWTADSYATLAEATSGKVIIDSGDASAAIMEALNQVLVRPTARLPLTGYEGQIGTEFKYDASMSSVEGSTIASYQWDFNGDGVFDRTTTEPVVYYTYPGEFDGNMQVRVAAANGTSSSASATVKVSSMTQPRRLIAPQNIVAEPLDNNEVRLTWNAPAGSTATKWYVMFNGVQLGYTAREQTSLIVTDVDRSIPTDYAVKAADSNGLTSEWAATSLPAAVSTRKDSSSATSQAPAVESSSTNHDPLTTGTSSVELINATPGTPLVPGSSSPSNAAAQELVSRSSLQPAHSNPAPLFFIAGGVITLSGVAVWLWRRFSVRS